MPKRPSGVNNHKWKGGSWNHGSLANAKKRLLRVGQLAKTKGFTLPNITVEDLATLLTNHSNKCDICGLSELDNGQKLSIDHCHTTGKVRGLLCNNCNNGLGRFMDSESSLLRAANYIRGAV